MAIRRWVFLKRAAAATSAVYPVRGSIFRSPNSAFCGNNCIFRSPISSFWGNNCIFRCRNSSSICGNKLGGRAMMMSTMRSSASSSSSSTLPSRTSPWLMLPPTFEGEGEGEGGDMIYKFFNLAEDKVESFKSDLPHIDTKFVGSSHGWLAFARNRDLFLSNPLTRRRVRLPPLAKYPIAKVIISCCPGDADAEEECRAMVAFKHEKGLAFCYPSRRRRSSSSIEWTAIRAGEECYEDFVYSSRQNAVFCITGYKGDLNGRYKEHDLKVEIWDIDDPLSPKIVRVCAFNDWRFAVNEEKYSSNWSKEPKLACWHLRYLVFSEQSNDLFLVIRQIIPHMGPDGQYVKFVYYDPFRGLDWRFPHKTIGFDVYKIDMESGKLRWYMDGHLDGLAMFIGLNHSFAVPVSSETDAFPGLKPDSIYFTDEPNFILPAVVKRDFGGHDNGIFNYKDGTFSSCYYPLEYEKITRIVPPPMWFSPNHQGKDGSLV